MPTSTTIEVTMSIRKKPPRFVMSALSCLVCLVGVGQGLADIHLPTTKADRDVFVERLQRICRDYPLSAVEDPADSGNWKVQKGDQIQLPTIELVYDEATNTFTVQKAGSQPSNVTPKGCTLVCGLIDNGKGHDVTLKRDDAVLSGKTANPGAAAKNGTGANANVCFNGNDGDGTYYVYDSKDASGAHIEIRHPRDISLAHELIHALHVMNGTIAGGNPEGQAIDGSNAGGPGGHGVTENDIREEQNKVDSRRPPLEERHGHCGGRN